MAKRKSPPTSKSFALREGVVRKLRLEKGWTASDLAVRARCSERTIENAEAGKPLSITTITLLAKAFEVEVTSLFENNSNETKSFMPSENRMKGFITISENYKKFIAENRQDEFITMLAQTVETLDKILVVLAREGSVILEIEMSENDWRKLEAAVFDAKLTKLKIKEIRFPINYAPTSSGYSAPFVMDKLLLRHIKEIADAISLLPEMLNDMTEDPKIINMPESPPNRGNHNQKNVAASSIREDEDEDEDEE